MGLYIIEEIVFTIVVKLRLPTCYDLKFLELDKRTTLVLENIRELDRVPSTKLPYILLLMVCVYYCAPYPNDHMYNMRPVYVVHAV